METTSSQPISRKLDLHDSPANLAKDGYNAQAESYLTWTSALTNVRPVWLDKLFNHIRNLGPFELDNSRCVDLGCGPGMTGTLKIAQQCGHILGIDISAKQIELTRSTFVDAGLTPEQYELQVTDMMEMDLPKSSVDVVCALYSIVHLGLPEQQILLGRIHEWLAPGGFVLLNTGTQSSQGSITEGWLGMTAAYWASFGGSGLLDVLMQIGFEIVESESVVVEGDATFTWVIARKRPSDDPQGSI